MKVKPQGKTDLRDVNPNETLVRVQKPTQGLKVKSHIRAGNAVENSARQSNYSRIYQDIN